MGRSRPLSERVFLPKEVGGELWRAAVAVADSYIVVPLSTVWDHTELFPMLDNSDTHLLPEWSYVVIHGEELCWLHLTDEVL